MIHVPHGGNPLLCFIEKQHEQTPRDPSSSQPPELLKALTRIRSVQLQTVQTLVALETVTHEKTPAVQLSVSAIECQLDILAGDTGTVVYSVVSQHKENMEMNQSYLNYP